MVNSRENQSLSEIVGQGDYQTFVEWFEIISKDNDRLKEEISNVPADSYLSVWRVFLQWTEEHLPRLINPGPTDMELGSPVLFAIAILLPVFTQLFQELLNPIPNELKKCLLLFNDALPRIKDSHRKLKQSIFAAVKTWYDLKLEADQQMLLNMVRYALQSAVELKSKQNEVKSVWNLRNLVSELYLTHREELKPVLLACTVSPKVLEHEDGRKFISHLFTLEPSFITTLHETIKNRLPQCKPAEAQLYGDVYFRAWRLSDGEMQTIIENDALQNLMFHAVHASPKPLGQPGAKSSVSIATLLFRLLHSIHKRKESATVSSMLNRLYEPFIWRSLNAPNALVRTNALHIFFDVFPFECDDGVAANEDFRKKQFDAMLTLLRDPVPSVRAAAIEGMLGVMAEFWPAFPLDVINKGMTTLLKDLLYDVSSPDVRLAVVKGLTVMAENRLTHNILHKLLPTTRNTLHDVNDRVRMAYVNMLNKVQSMRILNSWQVVGSDHLFARLAEDSSNEVCLLLVSLLYPQIHPADKDDVVALERCIKLIETNRAASRRFYQFSSHCMDPTQTTHFVLVIWKLLKNYAKRMLRKGAKGDGAQQRSLQGGAEPNVTGDIEGSSSDEENDEENGQNKENEDANDTLDDQVLTGLMDVVYCLVYYNLKKISVKEGRKYMDNVAKRFNKSAAVFLRCFKESGCLRPLLLVYSLVSNPSRTLISYVKSKLKTFGSEAHESHFSYLLDTLCNWGRGDDVVDLVEETVQRQFQAFESSRRSSRQSSISKKSVQFDVSGALNAETAMRMLSYVFRHPQNKKSLLQRNREQLQDLCTKMSVVTELIESFVETYPNKDIDPVLRTVAISYAKLTGILMSKSGEKEGEEENASTFDAKGRFIQILDWVEKVLVPPEAAPPPETRPGNKRRRGNRRLNETVRRQDTDKDLLVEIVNIGNTLVSVELADKELALRLGHVVHSFVQRYETPCMLSLAMFTALNLIGFAKTKLELDLTANVPEPERMFYYSDYHRVASVLVAHVLRNLRERSASTTEIFPTQEYDEIQQALKELLTKLLEGNEYCRLPQEDVFETLAVHIQVSMRDVVLKDPDVPLPGKIGELPPAVSLVVSASSGRLKVLTKLVKELELLFNKETITDINGLLGLAHVFWALTNSKGKIPRPELVKCVVEAEKLLAVLPSNAVDDQNERGPDSDADVSIDRANYAALLKDLFLKMKNQLSA